MDEGERSYESLPEEFLHRCLEELCDLGEQARHIVSLASTNVYVCVEDSVRKFKERDSGSTHEQRWDVEAQLPRSIAQRHCGLHRHTNELASRPIEVNLCEEVYACSPLVHDVALANLIKGSA